MPNFENATAFLIGVGAYIHPRFASLPATVRDAQAIAAVLTDPALFGPNSTQVDHAHSARRSQAIKFVVQGCSSEMKKRRRSSGTRPGTSTSRRKSFGS